METKTSGVICPSTQCLVLVVVLMWCAGCATSGTPLYPLQDQEEPQLIYVVSHGWHTGIVIKRDDVDAHFWPEKDDFPEALYLEVGWGDRDFYRTPKAGLGILLQAALSSPASVLFVIGMPTTVTQYFPPLQVAGLPIRKALQTGGLMRQLRRYGRVIQRQATSGDQEAS